jgi:hypothetical protein
MTDIKGTVRFDVYMFRATNVRHTATAKPNHYVYNQWGRIVQRDETGKAMAGKPFNNYGDMIKIINQAMRVTVRKDLKDKGNW